MNVTEDYRFSYDYEEVMEEIAEELQASPFYVPAYMMEREVMKDETPWRDDDEVIQNVTNIVKAISPLIDMNDKMFSRPAWQVISEAMINIEHTYHPRYRSRLFELYQWLEFQNSQLGRLGVLIMEKMNECKDILKKVKTVKDYNPLTERGKDLHKTISDSRDEDLEKVSGELEGYVDVYMIFVHQTLEKMEEIGLTPKDSYKIEFNGVNNILAQVSEQTG